MNFFNEIQKTLNNDFNYAKTENGALVFRTSGKPLLDLNFAVSSLRHETDSTIIKKFNMAMASEPLYALKWLFFARDVREGLGERRLFRVVMNNLAKENPEIVSRFIVLIAEYGRWDDMLCLLDTPCRNEVVAVIKHQLDKDIKSLENGKTVSLLAKWMPSINASSYKTIENANLLCKAFDWSPKRYRKTLSALRKKIDVVERKMSSSKWNDINYEYVPSKANILYKDAFLRHDEERRTEFLESLIKGDAKINAGTLFPHDIVHKYFQSSGWGGGRLNPMDNAIEALWNALPRNFESDNTIVVSDGSGSMYSAVSRESSVSAIEVALALSVYFAEGCSGAFENKFITFSQNPQLVDISKANTLHGKVKTAMAYTEVANTNIERVFDLILKTAINSNMSQDNIPKNILIISDMEFDSCACSNSSRYGGVDKRLFEVISDRYENAGYKLPRMIFWNVNSRTGAIPVKENDMGVALVSGFSTNIAKMIMSGETDPYKVLLETLDSERYAPIAKALS